MNDIGREAVTSKIRQAMMQLEEAQKQYKEMWESQVVRMKVEDITEIEEMVTKISDCVAQIGGINQDFDQIAFKDTFGEQKHD